MALYKYVSGRVDFWERVTGSDFTRDWQSFEARAAALPDDYRLAWEQITARLMPHGDLPDGT